MKNRFIPTVSVLALSIALTYPVAAQETVTTAAPVVAIVTVKAPSAAENLNHVKATLTGVQANVTSTMAALNTLKKVAKEKAALDAPAADFVSQYQALEMKLNALQQQAAAARTNTDAYFQTWQSSIATIQNKDIKETATERLNTAKSRYSRVLATADESRKKLQPFLADLKDIYTFLKVDMTADSVNSLSNTTWRLGRSAEGVVDGIADVIKDIDITLESLPKN
jgi:cysteinyl-tRNA synthetase